MPVFPEPGRRNKDGAYEELSISSHVAIQPHRASRPAILFIL
jgi:hypothetical protein